jgi:hypothetical protein
MLQFYGRHVFHLEFLGLWIDAVAVWVVATRVADSRVLDVQRLMGDGRARTRMLTMATAMALLVFVPLTMLRRYQIGAVEALLTRYVKAPSQPLAVEATTAGGGRVRLMPVLSAREHTQPRWPVEAEMLIADIGGPGCRNSTVDLNFTYVQKDNSPREDFSHVIRVSRVSPDEAATTVIAPIYLFPFDPHIVFKGIEVAENQVMCVTRIAHMTDPSRFPLLLETTLSPAWRQALLYQRLRNDTEVVPPHLRSAAKRILVRLRH